MDKKIFIGLCAAALAACAREVPPAPAPGSFQLLSGSFAAGSDIPSEFTCDGKNIRPALAWTGLPAGTRSLAIVVRDPDAPSGHFLHWAAVDIPASYPGLEAGAPLSSPVRQLANDAGTEGYFGPCPPSGKHRYVFTLYALGVETYAGGQARPEDYLDAHSLGKAVLTGRYQRNK